MQTIVYAPGVWDLLHVGHVHFLRMAKSLGDKLVVGVPEDTVVYEDKGECPIIPCRDRIEMLSAIKHVDLAIPYFYLEFLIHLNMVNPDILVIGEHWGKEKRHTDAENFMHQKGGRIVRLPYYRGESTTLIKQRIHRTQYELHEPQ